MKKKTKSLYDENGRWVEEHYAIKGAMRRLFRQHPAFHEAISKARVELAPKVLKNGELGKKNQIFHRCAMCGQLFKIKDIAVDHIEPVIPMYKRDKDCDYNELVERMYVRADLLQVLCNTKKKFLPKGESSCHSKKTRQENFIRDYVVQYFERLKTPIQQRWHQPEVIKEAELAFLKLLEKEKIALEAKRQRQLEREQKKLNKKR